MSSWENFQYRWDRMQSADIGRNTRDVAEVAANLVELEQFLVYVTAKALLGEPLTLEDKTLRTFLKIDKEDDPRRALVETIAHVQHRHEPKLVKCPRCGSGVRDLRGITDETCNFCGARVRTEG